MALAAEENDVWSTPYDEIRVYMDDATKADHNNLEGGARQVRIISPKYTVEDGAGNKMRLCGLLSDHWWTENLARKVTATDITRIDLARDKPIGSSPTISIPIGGNTKYKVTVSQQHHQGKIVLGHEVGGYDYLRIDITKREHHTVEYKFSGIADVDYPASVTLPASEQATATTKVTLPTVTTPITGTLNGKDGTWTFNGWALPDGVDFTDDTHTKFTMPDTNVTVTGTWTFEATPPTGTPVYVYFQTVNTAGKPIGDKDNENVKDVKHNENGNGWATLGKLTTEQPVSASTDKTEVGKLGKEVKKTNDKFEEYLPNENLNLDLIKWVELKQDNGAADYVKPGTNAWHLNGKVTAYRAIYCDSDGTELEGFTPNQTPEYYLKGATDIALTKEVPDVPGKVFDGWDTNDVTVENNNTFIMPDKDVTFTAKWKTGTLEIEKILEGNPPAAGNIFSFTVTPEGSTTGTDARITGAGNATIPILPVCNYTVEEDSNTAAVNGYRCTTQYSTDRTHWQDTPITVSVASNDTVTVYVKNSYTPITADLIDDAITIYHQVNSEAGWHGEDIGANMTYNYTDTDTNAHPVPKAADAKISYKAVLDMSYLDFGSNPQNRTAVDTIKAMGQGRSIWEYMQSAEIAMFAGSEVNLHVKFDEKLNVTKGSFDSIELASDWFRLADGYQNGLTKDSNGYWTIPCVIKDVKGTNNSPIITLSGITLLLTDAAQDELSSDKDLDVISEGYIDGTIKISGQTLKLESKTAKNTAKLKLAVPTYTVTYRGNGADSGETTDNTAYAPGTTATVKENGFTRSRYTFTGWNMKADGSGTPYKTGDKIPMTGSVILYAQWTRNSSHDNDDDKYFFAIQKVDAQDDHALNGAVFELYQRDSRDNKLAAFRKTTSHWGPESGIALFSVSATKTSDGGSTWYYREITAPEGYVLDTKEYEISARDFYHDGQSKAVAKAKTVRNYRGTTPDLLNDSDHFAYVIGYMDGNVRPYGLISRAETTTIFFRLLKDSVRDGNLLTSNTYTDVADDYWANTAISTMTGLGIVQGRSTTTFDPKAPITRAQFAAICARFDTGKSNGEQTFTDIKGHWAEKYIQRAAELGWIKGFEDGTFRPDTYITRAQAMTMINRVLNRIPEDESDLLPGMNVWPDCNPGDWFYLAVQEATNSHDFEHKAGNYETWTKLMKNPDWTRYEN